jgi:hypothetical protein
VSNADQPTATARIEGWRYWLLEPGSGYLRTTAIRTFPDGWRKVEVWLEKSYLDAVCFWGRHPNPPHPECRCGIYYFDALSAVFRALPAAAQIITAKGIADRPRFAITRGWVTGPRFIDPRTRPDEQGQFHAWRTSRYHVTSILIPKYISRRTTQLLSDHYHVPVRRIGGIKEAEGLAAEADPPVDGRAPGSDCNAAR